MTDEKGHITAYRNAASSERLRHFATNALLDNYTLYPSEYLTITTQGYTKYYYANGNRIASKIGTGDFEKMQQLCTLEQSLTANANTLFDNILQQAVNTTNPPADEYPVEVCNGYNVSNELLHSQLLDFYISNTVLNFTQNNLLQQFRQNLTGGTEAVYYFHSDHLGSASWITDGSGLPVQHLLYLPFGEHFVNERSAAYDERFTFTGKERDAETGYYYHGARFNSSDIGWLSVDPMAEKYPSMSPYAYCAWNPVKLVDPEGREIDNYLIFENGQIFKEETNDNTNTYTYIRGDGTEVDLGTYNVSQNDKGEDMVAIGDKSSGKNDIFSWLGINSGNLYFEEDAFAGLLGGIQSFYDENASSDIQPVRFNQLMSSNRVHSGKSNRHSAIDIAYYSSSGNPGAHADRPADQISIAYNTALLSSLKKFGLGSNNVFTSIDKKGSKPFLDGTKAIANHHHHMHLQGFAGNIIPPLKIIAKKQY